MGFMTDPSPLDLPAIRAQFPVLTREVNAKPLVYLDNAASAQKPDAVIDAMADQARHAYANVHRGLHTLANETTEAFEAARKAVQGFLNANSPDEIVFTKGATEAINLVASGLAADIRPGDEIVLSTMEHHSNIVPWHFLRERHGAVLKWVGLTAEGALDMAALDAAIGPNTRMVALSHMSNVLGTLNDARAIVERAHSAGAQVLLDGCQAVVHTGVDVRALDCDYYVFSGHKLYGPTGIGVLYGRHDALERLRPYQGGGEMIETVSFAGTTFGKLPFKFEAGTPNIAGAIGMAAAIDYLAGIDMAAAAAHEQALLAQTLELAQDVDGLRRIGNPARSAGIFSFLLEGAHPADLGMLLDQQGIAVRTGDHCAQPLMARYDIPGTVRASYAMYNTAADVERLFEGIHKAGRLLG